MKTFKVSITDLYANPANAARLAATEKDAREVQGQSVKDGVARNRDNNPPVIVVSKAGEILEGFLTVAAAKADGLTEIDATNPKWETTANNG